MPPVRVPVIQCIGVGRFQLGFLHTLKVRWSVTGWTHNSFQCTVVFGANFPHDLKVRIDDLTRWVHELVTGSQIFQCLLAYEGRRDVQTMFIDFSRWQVNLLYFLSSESVSRITPG